MFARSLVRCARQSVVQPLKPCRAPLAKTAKRRYSSSSGTASGAAVSGAPQSAVSFLGSLTSELDKISPRFEVQPGQIEILTDPAEFYETLKAKISKAQRRIYLSTLYIGKAENELISVIDDALQRSPDLKISFLTDALRGTRETPNPSCASLLASLITKFGPERVEVRMFHTPNLVGWRKKLIPRRINEGWGLQHMKLYGVDDELIMSGANLSNDYFTNRQDRYHVFSSKEITDYFHTIHTAISSLSYTVLPSPSTPSGYTMSWPASNPCPSPLTSVSAFRTGATTLLTPLIRPSRPPSHPPFTKTSTLIYPLLQFTPLLPPTANTSTEVPALTHLLTLLTHPAHHHSTWTFTAGYFNMTAATRALLLATNPAAATVIAASPWANGFHNSPGISGMLPAAYTLLARRFVDAVQAAGLSQRIKLHEWRRGTVGEKDGWTYHAKGLWLTLPPCSTTTASPPGPAITLVGSSNYTTRSESLDLEANALVVTHDADLQRRLGEEERHLREWASEVGTGEFERIERRVSWRVRVAMWIVGVVGGAL